MSLRAMMAVKRNEMSTLSYFREGSSSTRSTQLQKLEEESSPTVRSWLASCSSFPAPLGYNLDGINVPQSFLLTPNSSPRLSVSHPLGPCLKHSSGSSTWKAPHFLNLDLTVSTSEQNSCSTQSKYLPHCYPLQHLTDSFPGP